jgi:hypothetical protein
VLEVRAKEEYEVKLPQFGEKLEQFGIVDYGAPPARLLEGGVVLQRRSYTLEPFLSGEYKLPPMTVRYFRKSEGEGRAHGLESEELSIQIKSVLPEKAALSIKEIAGPVPLPRSPWSWTWVGIVAALHLAGLAAFWWWRRRRRRRRALVKISAHAAAYDALSRLLSQKLIESGRVKEFYLGLSTILRHYIEERFGLHAPERTTEEFMLEMRDSDRLRAAHKELLEKFLQHCDLVKFAEHLPGNSEIQGAFDACKRFIGETEEGESIVSS